MAIDFSETERYFLSLLKQGGTFFFKGEEYKIKISDKPQPSNGKGESKTDLYMLATSLKSKMNLEFKVSIKQSNADFLENKVSAIRAKEIFGSSYERIIKTAIQKIKKEFTNDFLIYFNKYGKTEANTIKIGWKFELLNKKSGEKSAKISLTDEQKIDVYAGTNLVKEKINAKVNGEVIPNSGIANYICFADINNLYNDIQDFVDNLLPIDYYAKQKDIYFACKALNYRAKKDKWDGNRPLAVWVQWRIENDLLVAKIQFNKPLSKHGNEIGNRIREILNELDITSKNFSKLKNHLTDNIKFYV